MQVEVWSDVVCPWCYIGKRRLESALEKFPHRDQVEVVWRSFQLDPSVPEGTTHPTLPALAAKYGTSEDAMRANMARVEQLAAEVGLDEAEVREALADRRYLAAVREDGATAQALGATGVPFFVVDRKYGAAGAQPAELLLQILERAWAEANPLTTVPAADGCTDDSCAV